MPFPTTARLLLNGHKAGFASALARTPMEDGPPKQARVRTQQLVTVNVTYRMTAAERDAFVDWYDNEIDRGASFFSWTDTQGTDQQARMVQGEFDETPVKTVEDGDAEYDIAFQLEFLR